MSAGPDFLREQAVVLLDMAKRRWLLIIVPILAAGILAAAALQFGPSKYVAQSLILLSNANRNVAGINSANAQRASVVEQVGAIEAWLKSDQVLAPLIPRLSGYEAPVGPNVRLAQLFALRNSLSLELVGGSVLQVKLEGRKPNGLGVNLEIILSRLMEGLTGPEQSIFSASQFVLMRRSDEVTAADLKLNRAVEASGARDPGQVQRALNQLWKLSVGPDAAPGVIDRGTAGVPQNANDLRQQISADPGVAIRLEALYAARQMALERLETLRSSSGAGRGNYVGIFDAPDNLLVVGRPADPIVGESIGRKLAIAGMLLSVMIGGGLVLAVEFMVGRLRTRNDFERASGLPVVARVRNIPAGGNNSLWRRHCPNPVKGAGHVAPVDAERFGDALANYYGEALLPSVGKELHCRCCPVWGLERQ